MELKLYKVRVECGEYWGGGTDGAWTSSTDKQFYTTVWLLLLQNNSMVGQHAVELTLLVKRKD